MTPRTTSSERRVVLWLLTFLFALCAALTVIFTVPTDAQAETATGENGNVIVNGADQHHDAGHTTFDGSAVTWNVLTLEDINSAEGKTAGYITGGSSAEQTVYYYLADNITLTENNITVSGYVTLCLNGYMLMGTGSSSVITISANANFTLCDCSGSNGQHKVGDVIYTGGVITGSTNLWTGGIHIPMYAESVTIYGGTIVNNYIGVFNQATATTSLTIYGGTFSNNSKNNFDNLNSAQDSVAINGGYIGSQNNFNGATINGGYFASSPSNIASGYTIVDISDLGTGFDKDYIEGYPYAVYAVGTWNFAANETAPVYDGEAITESDFTVPSLPEGVTVSGYSYRLASDTNGAFTSGLPTGAGEYVIRVTLSGAYLDTSKGKTYYSNTVDFTVTIARKDITNAEVVLGNALTYTGQEQEQTISSVKVDGLPVSYKVSGNTGTIASTDYVLTITGIGNFTGEATARWSIAQRDISHATITLGDTLTYTGQEQEQTIASVAVDGLTVTYEVSGNTGMNASTDYVLTITGTGNFTGEATARWSIAKAPLTITGVTATDRDYNGATVVELTGGELAGVLNNEDVGFTLGNGTAASANVGTGIAVTTDIQLTGTAAGNYMLTQPEYITVNISKATPTVETPSNIVVHMGYALSTAELPAGWAWNDGSQTVSANGSYAATYTPEDTANYNTVQRDIAVTVQAHSYGEWSLRTAPTTETTGLLVRSCDCGAEDTFTLPALNDTDYTVSTTDPTCTQTGSTTYTYEKDGQTIDVAVITIPEFGHDYTGVTPTWEWGGYTSATASFACTRNGCEHVEEITAAITSEVTTAATCESAGERTYTATVTFGEQTYTDTETEVIAATGHSYSDEWLHDESGHWHECENCDATSAVEDHLWGEWTVTKEATATEDGERQRTCSICGETQSEVIPATGEVTPGPGEEEPTGLSGGAIAGIVIGSVVGALLIAYGVLALLFKKGIVKGAFFAKIYPFIK